MRELDTRFNVQDDTWRPYITALEEGEDGLLAASLFRQETAAHGLLLASGFNLCLRHDDKVVLAETKDRLENIVDPLANVYKSNDPGSWLRGEIIKPTFQVRKP